MSVLIYRGTSVSDSARALRSSLREAGINARINRRTNSITRTRRPLINWGRRSTPSSNVILNRPVSVSKAADKLAAMVLLSSVGVRVPEFWSNPNDVPADAFVFARTVLNGHSGEGIAVSRPGEDRPMACLYTRYIPKRAEYRLHVFDDEVIFVQQKRKKNGVAQEGDASLIRSHHNGWVFAENQVEWSNEEQKQAAYDEAKKSLRVLGLDFGAVDLIISKEGSVPYVLEVNTAPALVSTRLKQAYTESIRSFLNERVPSYR